MAATAPVASKEAMMIMGMVRLTSRRWPNMTIPRMAPTLPIPEWTPNAVDLQGTERERESENVANNVVIGLE